MKKDEFIEACKFINIFNSSNLTKKEEFIKIKNLEKKELYYKLLKKGFNYVPVNLNCIKDLFNSLFIELNITPKKDINDVYFLLTNTNIIFNMDYAIVGKKIYLDEQYYYLNEEVIRPREWCENWENYVVIHELCQYLAYDKLNANSYKKDAFTYGLNNYVSCLLSGNFIIRDFEYDLALKVIFLLSLFIKPELLFKEFFCNVYDLPNIKLYFENDEFNDLKRALNMCVKSKNKKNKYENDVINILKISTKRNLKKYVCSKNVEDTFINLFGVCLFD